MLPLYIVHIKHNFGTELRSLMGKTLVCDCDADELCEADVLAGMVFEITCPDAAAPHPRAAGMPPRRIVRGPKRWQRAYRGFAGDNSCGFVGFSMETGVCGGDVPQAFPSRLVLRLPVPHDRGLDQPAALHDGALSYFGHRSPICGLHACIGQEFFGIMAEASCGS